MATQAQVDELRAKMAGERDALAAALRGMAEDVAEYRPPDRDGEDGWSVKEQVVHLAQMDARYRAWCERSVRQDRPDLDTPDDGAPAAPDERPAFAIEQAHEAPLGRLVEEMDRQRDLTLAFIEGLSLDDLDRTSRNRMFGELNVLQWLRSYYRHDRMHVAQVQGRPSEYQPRFREGEPDQRR
ncbi:MAG: DinB family protein [Dehalococcoidia bacterium]